MLFRSRALIYHRSLIKKAFGLTLFNTACFYFRALRYIKRPLAAESRAKESLFILYPSRVFFRTILIGTFRAKSGCLGVVKRLLACFMGFTRCFYGSNGLFTIT